MDKIKNLDSVAYVRFASVYREFKDVNTFMSELKKMLDKQGLSSKTDLSILYHKEQSCVYSSEAQH